jgi:flagellar biosynthesis/type III secretory pathway M-ring protein FliF/YscJ
MSILRFILYFVIFLILFRIVRSFLSTLFKSNNEPTLKSQTQRKKSKFEGVEDAKYIEIKPEDEKKN